MKRKTLYTPRDGMIFDPPETGDDDQVNLDTLAASAFADHSVVPFSGADGKLNYSNGMNEVRFVTFAHRLMGATKDDGETLCEIVPYGTKTDRYVIVLSSLGQDLVRAYGQDLLRTREEYPEHELSSILDFIWKTHRRVRPLLFALHHHHSHEEALRWVDIANKAVARLRALAPLLLGRWKQFKRPARKNFANMREAMNGALEGRRWATSCRGDFFIGKEEERFKPRNKRLGTADFVEMRRYRRRLVRHVENRFKNGFLKMFTKIEFGRDRFLHMHCHILLDGQLYKNPVELMDELGQTWEEITEGRGSFTNVHTLNRKLKYDALGVIDLHNHKVRIGLLKIISYFTLADVFVKLRLEDRKVKTFSIVGPSYVANRVGRRRKRALPVLTMSFADAISTISFM